MNKRLVALVITVYLLAAAWFAFAPLDLPSIQALAVAEDRWQLSAEQRHDADDALSSITAAHLFESAVPAPGLGGLPVAEKSLTPPDWRIAAVYVRKAEAGVALSVAGQPDRLLHVGDTLPGGARIVAIHPDGLSILLHGRRLKLSTYPE